MRTSLTVILIAALGTSCSGEGDAAELDGWWRPESVPSADLGPAFNSDAALLVLEDGQLEARDGCNDITFTGSYELEDNRFDVEFDSYNVAGSGCAEGSVFYPDLLTRVKVAEIQAGRLSMLDGEGELVAEFSRSPK